MMKNFNPLLLGFLLLGSGAAAQTVDLESLHRNIDILTGVLEEGLGVNDAPGLFGINLGQVDGLYLRNQGILVEVSSPLARQRNRLSLDALAFSIQSLPVRSNMNLTSREAVSREPVVLAIRSRGPADASRELFESADVVDYSTRISIDLRQAAQSMRSLRDLGEIDDARLTQLNQEIEDLRQQLAVKQEALRTAEQSLENPADATLTSSAGSTAAEEVQLEALANDMAELQQRAAQQAENLRELHDQARQKQLEEWQAEVAEFETDMFRLLCDYGATVRDLPANEFLTVVLSGLGEDNGKPQAPDKIHVFAQPDLLLCQSGAIDAAELQRRTNSYSY